jgi:hypothetical protein
VLERLLPEWRAGGHRVLLFSQTRMALDMLETLVAVTLGLSTRRMDGTTPIAARQVGTAGSRVARPRLAAPWLGALTAVCPGAAWAERRCPPHARRRAAADAQATPGVLFVSGQKRNISGDKHSGHTYICF